MTVATQLFSDIKLKFGFPRILHSDNGMECLSQQHGIKRHISPWHPQANRKLESSHTFIKDCICKFSTDVMEWDQMLPYASPAFNWFLNQHSQEWPHFLYFRSESYLPHLAACLEPKLRCLGLDTSETCLDKLRQAYMLPALNTQEAHSI